MDQPVSGQEEITGAGPRASMVMGSRPSSRAVEFVYGSGR